MQLFNLHIIKLLLNQQFTQTLVQLCQQQRSVFLWISIKLKVLKYFVFIISLEAFFFDTRKKGQ